MKRRGCGINVIIEGLVVNRQGVITESAEEQVQKDIKAFLSEHNVPGIEKKHFYNLLKSLYEICNNAGPYKFIKGDTEFIRGGVDKADSEAPVLNVSLYEMCYDIRFLAAVEIKKLYAQIRNTFREMKSDYKTFNADSFAITVGFDSNEDTGLYFAVEKASQRALKVRIGYQEYIAEAATGLCGTEVGLPIDKENCEGTDVGGISTPTGGFSKDKKKKVFPSIIDEKEDEKDKDKEHKGTTDIEDTKRKEEEIDRFVCPKCQSPNVNSDGSVIVCSDCSYSWSLSDEEEDIRDHMLPQEDDIDASDYQKKYGYRDSKKNEVECIQTQQNTDKSDLV